MLRRFLRDSSLWLVLGANGVTMFQAFVQGWSADEVLWTFWCQSVVIGVFAAMRLFRLRSWFMGLFFLLHYGFFHVIYAFFLMDFTFPALVPLFWSVLAFVVAHGTSSFVVYPARRPAVSNTETTAFFLPYARIVPMHLTLIFFTGFLGGGEVFGLLLLKSVVDGITHIGIHWKDLVYPGHV